MNEECLVCGSDNLIEFTEGFQCQRCGAMNNGSSAEYGRDVEDNIKNYDKHHGE